MSLQLRIAITVVAMLLVSFLAGRLWFMAFGFAIPSYLAGMVGGLTAIPVWEFMRWINTKSP